MFKLFELSELLLLLLLQPAQLKPPAESPVAVVVNKTLHAPRSTLHAPRSAVSADVQYLDSTDNRQQTVDSGQWTERQRDSGLGDIRWSERRRARARERELERGRQQRWTEDRNVEYVAFCKDVDILRA